MKYSNYNTCPKCKAELQTEICPEITCESGRIDVSEEFFEVEGSRYEKCSECGGKGHVTWCPKCGYEV